MDPHLHPRSISPLHAPAANSPPASLSKNRSKRSNPLPLKKPRRGPQQTSPRQLGIRTLSRLRQHYMPSPPTAAKRYYQHLTHQLHHRLRVFQCYLLLFPHISSNNRTAPAPAPAPAPPSFQPPLQPSSRQQQIPRRPRRPPHRQVPIPTPTTRPTPPGVTITSPLLNRTTTTAIKQQHPLTHQHPSTPLSKRRNPTTTAAVAAAVQARQKQRPAQRSNPTPPPPPRLPLTITTTILKRRKGR